MKRDYETVIGLEIHAELLTKSKIFCGCSTRFGAPPNTQCCPVCMGLPGALPTLNARAVELAARAGLAAHCSVAQLSRMDRKNYFYPDLPKAYQITQFFLPLCRDGYLVIPAAGGEKRVGIERIHIEEDAGKLTHVGDETLCDYNRCGVPLIEVVTRPDLRSAAEAAAFVRELRSVLRYAGVCDGKMQEGSLRVDVNLSVRPAGQGALGERTEIKNINSISFMAKAIEAEAARQARILQEGGRVERETRRFDERTGRTLPMRGKESAADYRYFPEPDLPPIALSAAQIEAWRAALPRLPEERRRQYRGEWGLSENDTAALLAEREVADCFEAAAACTPNKTTLAHLFCKHLLRLHAGGSIPVAPRHLAQVADLLAGGRITGAGAKTLIERLWERDGDPAALAETLKLWVIGDKAALRGFAEAALRQSGRAVDDYCRGKARAAAAVVGCAMGLSGGRAEPALLGRVVEELLAEEVRRRRLAGRA